MKPGNLAVWHILYGRRLEGFHFYPNPLAPIGNSEITLLLPIVVNVLDDIGKALCGEPQGQELPLGNVAKYHTAQAWIGGDDFVQLLERDFPLVQDTRFHGRQWCRILDSETSKFSGVVSKLSMDTEPLSGTRLSG
ncbi:MAG: hypothetical protein HYX89_08050 [Chloroflexi bacterium]|nr:hypothetical protein [Chloroflexota bacterium]